MNNTFGGLKSASLFLAGGAGQIHSYLNITVRVKNVAYWKDVQLHMRAPYGGGWNDIPLGWSANYGDYDVFTLSRDIAPEISTEFVIRYTLGGRTYWDNNNGANYYLNGDDARTGVNNVALNTAQLLFFTSYPTGISGEIYVNNLSFTKNVGIRYSLDNWFTYFDQAAIYNAPSAGGETWTFGLNLTPQSVTGVKFAVYYQNMDTGQWYWDNNFGQNYGFTSASNYQLG